MIHDSAWFEMKDHRKPRFATASWVPLFARQITRNLKFPETEHWEEWFDAVAITFPVAKSKLAGKIEWMDANQVSYRPQVENGTYRPASRFMHFSTGLTGDYLVLQNSFETGDAEQLLFDPDLILGLRLRQEGDRWLAPYEDYQPVIRQRKSPDGRTDTFGGNTK